MIMTYSLAAVMPWYSLSYVGCCAPVAAFLLLLHSPESPVFLVNKGDVAGAEASLRKLYSEKFDVVGEIKEISQGLDKCGNNNNSRTKWEVFRNIPRYPNVKPKLTSNAHAIYSASMQN